MAINQELERTLQQTGQAIIDFAPFDPQPLQSVIASHLASYREKTPSGREWQAARIARQLVGGVLSHMICTAAIVNISEVPHASSQASGIQVVQQFCDGAEAIYEAPSRTITDLAADPEHPLFDAGQFLMQTDNAAADIEANPDFDPFREGGRLWTINRAEGVKLSHDYIASALKVNALGNGKEVLVLGALAHTINNMGEPPCAEELTARISGELPQLECSALPVGPQSREWMEGHGGVQRTNALVRAIAAAPKDDEAVALARASLAAFRWSTALEKYFETANPAVFAKCSIEGVFLNSDLALSVVRKLGRCGGRLVWRPRLVADSQRAQQYFEETHGNFLDLRGTFTSVQFMLTHNLDVARGTIFANKDYREALAVAANYIIDRKGAGSSLTT